MGTHHYDVPKLLDKARHGYRRARSSQPSGCFTAWAVGRGAYLQLATPHLVLLSCFVPALRFPLLDRRALEV